MPKKNRALDDEIRWGIELADGMGLDYDEDDYWEDEKEDDGPSPEEIRAGEILDDVEDISLPEEATEDEARGLEAARQTVRDALDMEAPDAGAIATAEGLLKAARDEALRISKAVADRKDEHGRITEAFSPLKEIKGTIKPHETRIGALRQKASEALSPPVTEARNLIARAAVEALAKEIEACKGELEDLGGTEGLEKICEAFGVDEESFATLDAAFGDRKAFLQAVKDFGSPAEVAKHGKAYGPGTAGLKAMAEVMAAMGGAAKLTKAAKDMGGPEKLAALTTKGGLTPDKAAKLCSDLGPGFIGALMGTGDDPAAAIALQTEFGGDIGAFADLVKEAGFDTKPATLATLLTEGCKGNPAEFKSLCKTFATPEDRAALKGIVDKGGLGDAPKALGTLMAEGCKGDPKMLKAFAKGFATDEDRAGLSRLMADAGLTGEVAKIDKGGLGALFQGIAGDKPEGVSEEDFAKTRAETLAKLAKGLDKDACGKLKTVLTEGGLGADPAVLGPLLGKGCKMGDPAKVKELITALQGDATAMTGLDDLLKKGGLGTVDDGGLKTKTKADCLAALLDPGCKGEPSKLLTLVKGLDDETRKTMKGMMAEGLGQAPKALGELVNTGCKADPKALKAMVGGFDSETKRKGLGRMLEAGGLKAEGDKISAATLGQLFLNIGGEKATGVSDDDHQKARAKALAEMAEKLDGTDCTRLKAVLETGGLGTEPEVFSHLLGIGCDKGKAADVKDLLQKVAADGPGMTGLDALLKKGGFGAKDDTGTETKIDTKCLANLFKPGCEGKPEEILKLVKALGDTDRTAMKGLMTEADLGKHPKVLGKMYKHGCLTDPNGGHGGEKNPKVLKDMIGEFTGTQGKRVFKDMLNGSGFAEDGQEDRLGSVLRHAFTKPRGAPKVQNAKSLRKLANAFDGNFGDLKTMIEAMEGATDDELEISTATEPNQPGKGLRNIIHAPKFNGDPKGAKDLRADFFVPSRTRVTGANQGTEGSWGGTSPPKIGDLKEFIRTAATFEHEPCSATVQVGPNNIDFDMDHAAGRHSRKHGKFHLNTAPAMGTTLFPRQTDEAAIKTLVTESITPGNNVRGPGQGGANRPGGHPPPGPRRTPPEDRWDLNNPGAFLRTNGTDTSGGVNRVGFGKTGVGDGIKISQFYPISGVPPLKKLNTNDFIAMNNVLTNNTKAYK